MLDRNAFGADDVGAGEVDRGLFGFFAVLSGLAGLFAVGPPIRAFFPCVVGNCQQALLIVVVGDIVKIGLQSPKVAVRKDALGAVCDCGSIEIIKRRACAVVDRQLEDDVVLCRGVLFFEALIDERKVVGVVDLGVALRVFEVGIAEHFALVLFEEDELVEQLAAANGQAAATEIVEDVQGIRPVEEREVEHGERGLAAHLGIVRRGRENREKQCMGLWIQSVNG